MLVQVVVVILPAAGDHHHLSGAQLVQHIPHRQACPAGAQHQALAAQNPDPALPHHAFKPGGVGVVPEKGAVRLLDHRVHAADGLGSLGQMLADVMDCGLIGNGHVQALEIPLPEKVSQVPGGYLEQLVVVVPKEGVKLRGVAVTQLFPQQSESHQITSL